MIQWTWKREVHMVWILFGEWVDRTSTAWNYKNMSHIRLLCCITHHPPHGGRSRLRLVCKQRRKWRSVWRSGGFGAWWIGSVCLHGEKQSLEALLSPRPEGWLHHVLSSNWWDQTTVHKKKLQHPSMTPQKAFVWPQGPWKTKQQQEKQN